MSNKIKLSYKIGQPYTLLLTHKEVLVPLSREFVYLYLRKSANVSSSLNHRSVGVNALSHLTPNLGDLVNQKFRS